MTLVRWEPAREMASLQDEVNRLFSSFFDTPAAAAPGRRRWIPAMDLAEREAEYVLHADLPGLGEDDVTIEVDGDVLTIAGHREVASDTTEKGVHRVERASGAFRRSLTLPDGVDAEQIEASFDKGVLEVHIPKPEQRAPRRVTISAGRPDVEHVEAGDAEGAPA